MKAKPALLRAVKKLDQDALTTIFDTYAPAIYRYILRFCHAPTDSDRLVGDVFTQFLLQVATDPGSITDLRTYLYQIAYRLLTAPAQAEHLPVDLDPESDLDSIQIPGGERAVVKPLVTVLNNELNELERHVIVLRFVEDFSLHETVGILSRNVNDVEILQNDGIMKLRKCLGSRPGADWKSMSS